MIHADRRTWQKLRVGHVQLSVHLDAVVAAPGLAKEEELAGLTRQLIDLANAHALPVTWAVSDPAFSAATPCIMRSEIEHELAILGDANWIGPTAGRTRFARELARRVSHSRDTGIRLTTLVPRVASIERHIDLVVKQRITAVAGVEMPQSVRRVPPPRALHYGVWQLPVSGTLPMDRRWSILSGWRTWRAIRRAAAHAAVYHLVLDVPMLLKDPGRAVSTIAQLLRRIADLRNRGLIRVETLGMAATRLANVPAVSPQCSILHRAA